MRVRTPRLAAASTIGIAAAIAGLLALLYWQSQLLLLQSEQFAAVQALLDSSPALNASAYALLVSDAIAADAQREAQARRVRESGAYPEFALALKTGAETAAARASVQLLTFLSRPVNILVFAEAPTRIGSWVVEDVYSNAYKDARARISAKKNETAFSKLVRRALESIQVIGGSSKSKGWSLDAHKNLPGFKLLHDRFPLAEWYIMFDDDTYLMLENLAEYLGSLNASKPYYIGQPNRFKGCDGVKEFGQGPFFGQGGAGIIISRGAMNAMAQILDNCIIKYESCWAGDIRTGLCLRDAGVNIAGKDGLHGSPPNAEFYFPDDPCTKPLTFHHSLPHQIQTLYDIEMFVRKSTSEIHKPQPSLPQSTASANDSNDFSPSFSADGFAEASTDPSNPTKDQTINESAANKNRTDSYENTEFATNTTAPTAAPTIKFKRKRRYHTTTMGDIFRYLHLENAATKMSLEQVRMRNNTDIRGRVSRSRELPAARECFAECEKWGECVGWVYDGRTCWMKKGPGRAVDAEGMWAGVFVERYTCRRL